MVVLLLSFPSCPALPFVHPSTVMHASVAGMLGKTGSKKTIVLGSPIGRSANRQSTCPSKTPCGQRLQLRLSRLAPWHPLLILEERCNVLLRWGALSSPSPSEHHHSTRCTACHTRSTTGRPRHDAAAPQHQCARQMGPLVDQTKTSTTSTGIGAANLSGAPAR